MKGLISIIVPVHNAEKYLNKCIESVIGQEYRSWELLLVDDGSRDKSFSICDEYSQKDKRIRCFHTESRGCAYARKVGMKNAAGDLITFLDSDDWIDPDTLRSMHDQMKEASADCVAAGYMESLGGTEKKILNRLPSGIYCNKKLQEEFYPAMLSCADYFEMGIQPFLWNKLFKRELIEKAVFEIDEQVMVGEDVMIVFPAFLQAGTISIMGKAFYHYRVHKNSTMKTYRTEREEVNNIRQQYKYLQYVFQNSTYAECLMPQLKRYILHHLMARAFPAAACLAGREPFFLFGDVQKGSRIVLYGAGALGSSIYHYMRREKDYEICCWCDGDIDKYQKQGYPVYSIEDALKGDFDYILIAVMKQVTAKEISIQLILKDVDPQKILWLNLQRMERYDLSALLG